jgi:hypothetical protein
MTNMKCLIKRSFVLVYQVTILHILMVILLPLRIGCSIIE